MKAGLAGQVVNPTAGRAKLRMKREMLVRGPAMPLTFNFSKGAENCRSIWELENEGVMV